MTERNRPPERATSATPATPATPATLAKPASPPTPAKPPRPPTELAAVARIGELAGIQHGVVSRRQLLAAGLTRGQVEGKRASGLLRVVHRGVYAVGPVTAALAEEMAAVLACAPGAWISHETAASLADLLPRRSASTPVHLIVLRDRGRRPGICAHRVERLEDDEVTAFDGIPATAPARTLLDLAADGAGRRLERALAEAERRNLVVREDLETLLRRHPGHRGIRALRMLLDSGVPALTRSEAEERFLALVRRFQLPPPRVNVVVAGYEVDFYWERERVIVEVDGFASHRLPDRFEYDHRRDRVLKAEGFEVVRVTWRQIVEEPEPLMRDLIRTLERARLR